VRTLALVVPFVVGCGRLAFSQAPDAPIDAPTDAAIDTPIDVETPPVSFGAGCAVGVHMDEPAWTGASGEILNSCDPADNGTAVQGAGRVDDSERGRVGEFPAPSGCLQFADAPALHATTGLTLSAWIYPLGLDDINPYGVIAKRTDFTNDDAEYTMFIWTGNTVWVDIDSRNDRNHGNTPLINGRWQQITAVYDGTLPAPQRVAIYVDGMLDTTLPETSTSLTPHANPLSIGCLPELPSSKPQIALAGRIDDAGVWTRAFSAQEVAAWYVATKH
jgi:hypothetical protein